MLYSNVKNILQIGENETVVDFEIKELTDTDVSILINIQNQNGLEIVKTQEDTLELNERKTLAVDRTVSKWSTYTIQVKAKGQSSLTQYVLKIDQNAALRSFIKEYKNQTQKNLEDFLDDKGAMLFEENSNTYRVEYDYKVFTLNKQTLEITNESNLNELILTGKKVLSIVNGTRKFDKIVGRVKSYGNITSFTVTTPSSNVGDLTYETNYKYEYSTTAVGVYTITARDQYGNQKSVSVEITDHLLIYDRKTLEDIKYDLSAKYMLVDDIDLSDKTYTSVVIPGNFKGTIDGNGHKIKNLSYTLLNPTDGAIIKNLKVEDVTTNLVFGEIGSTTNPVKFSQVGVTGTAPLGDGFVRGGFSNIDDCYCRVNYTSRGTWAYGFGNGWHSTFKRCYWSGTWANNNGSYSGAISAGTSTYEESRDCHYNKSLFYPSNSTEAADKRWSGWGGLNADQFANKSCFPNWDFDNVWIMSDQGYPELRVLLSDEEIRRLEGLPINGGTASLVNVVPTSLSGVAARSDCPKEYAIDGNESTGWYGSTYGKSDYNFNFTFDKAYRFFSFSIVGANPESIANGAGYHYVLYGGNDSADGDTGWTELYRCDNTGEVARFTTFRGIDLNIYSSKNVSYKYLRLVMGPNNAGNYIPTLREISFKSY